MNEIDPILPQHFERTVPKLIVAAACAIVLTLGASALIDVKINKLLDARNWSEHSLEVQSNLQMLQARLDRFDALAHLYLLNRAPSTLRETQNLSVTIEFNARHIATLVSDNPEQNENVQRLDRCVLALVQLSSSLEAVNAVFPGDMQLSCRETVSLMQERERVLAEARSKSSERDKVSLMV